MMTKSQAAAEKRPITVVSGLPRSGTSLMMQMLAAAGMQTLADGVRAADADNPNGYFELESTKKIHKDASFLAAARGKVVKVVAPLLTSLPGEYDYCIVFMERSLEEIMTSQEAMMRRAGRPPSTAAHTNALRVAFEKCLQKVRAWLRESPNVEVLYAPHRFVLESPHEASAETLRFLARCGALSAGTSSAGHRANQQQSARMAGAVDPALYRCRHP